MSLTLSTDESIYQTLLCDIKHDNLDSTPFIFRNHQDGSMNPIYKLKKHFESKIMILSMFSIETSAELFDTKKISVSESMLWDDPVFA